VARVVSNRYWRKQAVCFDRLGRRRRRGRGRIHLELSTRHAATLSSVRHTLRSSTAASGLRTAPPQIAQRVDKELVSR